MAFNLFDLGQALNAGAGAVNQYRQQRTLGDLGTKIQSGDWKGAAQNALAAGDLGTGISLLKLGQEQTKLAQEKENNDQALRMAGLTDGGASVSAPIGGGGGGEFNFGKSYALYKSAGASDDEARNLAAITMAESSGNPKAHNTTAPDDSYGLAQINTYGRLGPERLQKYGLSDYKQLYDPATNARVALDIARGPGGLGNWSVYKSGSYRQYLPQGGVEVADASGAVPQSAVPPSPAISGAGQYDAQIAGLTRALALAKKGSSAEAAIQARLKIAERKQQETSQLSPGIREYEYAQTHPDFAEYQRRQRSQESGPKAISPGGVLVDATGKELYKNTGAPEMSDETAGFIADRILAGDTRALTGVGRGAQGAGNIAKINELVANKARVQGLDPTDILAKTAEQSGLTAQQRTFGTQTARMASASTEAQGAIALGRQASLAVPRGTWVPVTKAIQAYQAGSSDPALAKFAAANLAIINTYARAINPNGQPTVADKSHAEQMLSTAQGQDSYNATLDQMQAEIDLAHKSPQIAKSMLENIRKGRPAMENIQSSPLTPEKGPFTTEGATNPLPSGWTVKVH